MFIDSTEPFFYSRLEKLEESLKDESLSESQKQEKRQQHAQKETEFLRLKRSRLGVEDFEPLKVSSICIYLIKKIVPCLFCLSV